MRRLTYILQFHRAASSDETEAPTIAHSLVATTHIDDKGVSADLAVIAGGQATMATQYALNQDQSQFFEWGTITFNTPMDTLTFTSIGAGTLLGEQDPSQDFNLGGVLWRISSGTGFFAGAKGLIASNFLIDLQSNELTDTQIHTVYLP
jgi:hypothetical protein